MNKKQEKALFGNALPKESVFEYEHEIVRNMFRFTGKLNYINANNLIHLARSQREAIGALIEILIVEFDSPLKDLPKIKEVKKIILSAVIQDTWEDVRKAWEENQ